MAAAAALLMVAVAASACTESEADRERCGVAGASCPTTSAVTTSSEVAPSSTPAQSTSTGPAPATSDPASCESEPIPAFNLGGVVYTARSADDAVSEGDLGEELDTQAEPVPEDLLRCEAVTLLDGEGSMEQGARVYAIRGVDSSIAIAASSGTGYIALYAPNDQSDPTTPTGSASSDTDYDALLRSLDVAVDLAPSEAVQLGTATLCGWDQLGGPSKSGDKIDANGRACFVAAHRAGTPAVFVDVTRGNEGSTVPIIFRTEDGQTTMYWDWTKSLSSEQWRTEPCAALYVSDQPDETAPLVFSCTPSDGSSPA